MLLTKPGPVRLEGGVSRWLVGVVGLGAELHQRPHAARGRFFNPTGVLKRAVSRPSGACSREGQGGGSRCFLQPTASLVKCARRNP
jgi:hypothetical protein